MKSHIWNDALSRLLVGVGIFPIIFSSQIVQAATRGNQAGAQIPHSPLAASQQTSAVQELEGSLFTGSASDVPIGSASMAVSFTAEGQLRTVFEEERKGWVHRVTIELCRQHVNNTPEDEPSSQERVDTKTDRLVPDEEFQPPTSSSPTSDLPSPIDPEPEPYPNAPAPQAPPAIQPTPAEPGLPPPPMPQPAEPRKMPPPVPQPADPLPLTPPELPLPTPATPEPSLLPLISE